MIVEVVYKNGRKERRICSPDTTMHAFVSQAEHDSGSKIQSMRIVKRNEHLNRGNNPG